jgi:folate-binding protein YgfZ
MTETTLNWDYIQLTNGRDAVLNNLITANLSSIHTKPQWTAFCNVQGKVITTAWIWREDNAWMVACHHSIQPMLIDHIQRYALRHAFTTNIHHGFVHPTLSTLKAMIEANHPIIEAHTSEKFLPQMLKVDDCDDGKGAIDWQKGCYLGQEIIMRTQQLGRVKRILKIARIATTPKATTLHDQNNQLCGHIINHTTDTPCILNCVINQGITVAYCDGVPIELIS